MSHWQIVVNLSVERLTARPAPTGAGARRPRRGPDWPLARALARAFGLKARREVLYEDFRLALSPGEVIAVTGPSGSGKTWLLRRVAAAVEDAVVLDLDSVAACAAPAIEALDARPPSAAPSDGRRGAGAADLGRRLEILSRCGLAEASALLTPACRLSGGQAFRLALARAIWQAVRAGRPRLLLIDEFGATLDAQTAEVLARQMPKLARRYRLGLIISTPRQELLAPLAPARILVKGLNAPPVLRAGPLLPAPPPRWRIVRGSLADYRQLARFHYLAGPPAAHKRVWVVRVPRRQRLLGGPTVAGVLVVSPPVLCCRGRNAATAGRYARCPNRRRAIQRLNAELECISRVIVHPIFRCCGLAVRLVRHAVRTSPTPLVEALAAMGTVHPFFELAGMTFVGRFAGRTRQYCYYLHQPASARRGLGRRAPVGMLGRTARRPENAAAPST